MNFETILTHYASVLLKEEEEQQQERLNAEDSTYLLSDILIGIKTTVDSHFSDISRARTSGLINNNNIDIKFYDSQTKNNIDITLNLEKLFSEEISRDQQIVPFENFKIQYDLANIERRHDNNIIHAFKDLLELFSLYINHYFGGMISSKQTSTDDSIGLGDSISSNDTSKFKTSFFWTLIKNRSGLKDLLRNRKINLHKQIVGKDQLSFYDLSLLKSCIIFVFDSFPEVYTAIGINIESASQQSGNDFYVFAKMMKSFITMTGFEHYIISKTFRPSSEIAIAPNMETGEMKQDTVSRPRELKEDIFKHIAYIKYLILRYIRDFVLMKPVSQDNSFQQQTEDLSWLIHQKIQMLKEEQEQITNKERIIGLINHIVAGFNPMDVSSQDSNNDYEMSTERFDHLILRDDVKDQVELFQSIIDQEPSLLNNKDEKPE